MGVVASGDRAGERVAERFTIERFAGSGGMGAVYRAIDLDGRPVALKVLAHEGDDAAARFAREAEVLSAISHSAIVGYVAHGTWGSGEAYLAMEWIDGEDLAARLAGGTLAPKDTLTVARRIAAALAELHKSGIIHRDVKPSNVFLRGGELASPVLLDLGIARHQGLAALTRTGSALGTPQYMAPEQISDATSVGPATDVYALGSVIFECLAGRPVFLGESAVAVLAKVLMEAPPALAAVCPGVSGALSDLVGRMLDKDPRRRPADGTEAARALERIDDAGATALDATVAAAPGGGFLTTGAQRLVSVVIAEDATAEAVKTLRPEELRAESNALGELVTGHGAELAMLGPHQFLLTVPPSGVATDQAARAARAALALSHARPAFRVALAMGLARDGGAPVGEAIDRAVALLTGARPGRVLVDETAAGLLGVAFDIRTEQRRRELVGERDSGERPRLLLGRETPCVGRDRELGVLDGLIAEVCDEEVARAALVTGPPGAGKSRLRYEFVHRLARRDPPALVWIARTDPMRAGSPLDSIAQLVRAATDADPDDLDAARQRLRDAATNDEAAAFLGELCAVPFDDADLPRLAAARRDARLMGDQMLAAWLALLRSASDKAPLVLVLEDLQWADAQTIRYVDVALRELSSARLMVLALARPEVHETFRGAWSERHVQEIRLGPLSKRAAERLARSVLGDVDAATIEQILRHAEGNALYLEETIRAAASSGLEAAPSSVLAMMQARLSAMDAGARRVIAVASLLGEAFHAHDVEHLAGAAGAPGALLQSLVNGEVLVRQGQGDHGDAIYAFRHALVREAAYGLIAPDERQRGHALAARWLEERGERDYLLLAEHYQRGACVEDAARCQAHAAAQAYLKNDFDGALVRSARAIADATTSDVLRDARTARGRALACLGRWAEAQAELEQALALTDDREQRIQLLGALWFVGIFRQDPVLLERTGDEALALARELGREELVAEGTCALSVAEHAKGNTQRAAALFREGSAHARDRASLVVGLSTIVLYHAGAYEEIIRWAKRMHALAERAGDWSTAVVLSGNAGMGLAGLGRYGEADAQFSAACELARKSGLTTLFARTLSLSAGYSIDAFDYEAGEARAREACEAGQALEFSTPRVSSTLDLAFLAARRGDPARGRAIADSVADAVRKGSGFHGWLWRCRRALLDAELALAEGDIPAAIELSARATAAGAQFGREKYVVLARLTHARALHAAGRAAEAARELAAARGGADALHDPALELRVALATLDVEKTSGARAAARRAVATVDALFADDAARARFRASREISSV